MDVAKSKSECPFVEACGTRHISDEYRRISELHFYAPFPVAHWDRTHEGR
jgi:hypothetical protein